MKPLNAWQWVAVTILAVLTVANFAVAGKGRKPLTPRLAVAFLIINAVLAWAVVMA